MIKFFEKSHRYTMDGKPVPSVTTLLNGGLPKPALTYWAARTVAEFVADNDAKVEELRGMGRAPMVAALKEVPWQNRDSAAVRGTDVHTYAEQLVNGDEVAPPEHLVGYVQACAHFLDDFGVEPVLNECSVGNRAHWWAGRLDLVGRLRDGRLALIDWKTNASGIFPEAALQLSAYAHAEFWQDTDPDFTEHPMPQIDLALGVHLRPDGYDAVPLDAGDQTYKVFRHIAYVATAAKNLKQLLGAPIHPDTLGVVA